MKGTDMKCRKDIETGKGVVDRIIARMERLEDDLREGMEHCCNNGDFDNRHRFTQMLGHLNEAKGSMYHLRAAGGEVQGGDFSVQSGGT